MPWSLARRDGKVCVIKDSDGSVAGCHASRGQAMKQMRALYANESRVASMYAELDMTIGEYEEVAAIPESKTPSTEIVRIVMEQPQENPLTASVVQALDTFTRRMDAADRITEAMVAALDKETVVNISPSEVNVESPSITVQPPAVTVEAPSITVEAPNVMVKPEIMLPPQKRSVTFKRDLYGDLTGADIEEDHGDVL